MRDRKSAKIDRANQAASGFLAFRPQNKKTVKETWPEFSSLNQLFRGKDFESREEDSYKGDVGLNGHTS